MNDVQWDLSLDAVAAAPDQHLVLFEDDNIRVLRVALDGGDSEPNHHHRWSSVFVFDELPGYAVTDYDQTGRKIGDFDLGDAPKIFVFPPQTTHSVENAGDRHVRGIRIEFKNGQLKSPIEPRLVWG
jgi:hypothetical protein